MKKQTAKTISFIVIAALLTSLLCVFASAEEDPIVLVTISDGTETYTGFFELTDADSDGALTINDSLIIMHDLCYEGGAAAGYGSAMSQYGLGMTKLWGIENGGSYGYYVNDQSAFSLTDPVKDGDYVYAFVYTDTTAWSDAYCFFDQKTVALAPDEEVELELAYYSYDENWNLVPNVLSGAGLCINGKDVNTQTDGEGKVKLSFSEEGVYEINAKSDSVNITRPVCIIYVEKTEQSETEAAQPTKPATTPKTGDSGTAVIVVLSILSLTGAAYALKKNRSK